MDEITSSISAISKVLSNNDAGKSGSHQAGILIPRQKDILAFFPELDSGQKNPFRMLVFIDEKGLRWEFKFIYYNNRFFDGTRNEFRLTRMTGYIREKNLKSGDEIVLAKDEQRKYHISYQIEKHAINDTPGTIILGSGWKIRKFKR